MAQRQPRRAKRYSVQIEQAARQFNSLPVEVQTLLRLCDGRRSMRQLREESGIGGPLFERVLDRMIALGLIAPTTEPRTEDLSALPPVPAAASTAAAAPQAIEPARDVDFTAAEEAFFSSGIDHLLEPEERESPSIPTDPSA